MLHNRMLPQRPESSGALGKHCISTLAFVAATLPPRLVRALRRPLATAMATPKSFRIALCQTPVTPSKSANLATAREYLDRAHGGAARIAVLPECFNCPYDTGVFSEYAELIPPPGTTIDEAHKSPSVQMLQEAARDTGMYIVGGSIPERTLEDSRLFNSSVSVSPEGTVLAKHRKVHLFDVDVPGGIRFKESDSISAGGSVTAFEAPELGLTVGVAVCYDMRFPELAMLQTRMHGARLLVYPGAFNMTTGPAHWELLLRARALDNQVYVAACSPARSDVASGCGYKAWGHSSLVDPWGTVVGTTDEKEDLVFGEVNMDVIKMVRRAVPTCTQRRSDIYQVLATE